MPYIVKNVSGNVVAIPLEGTLSISLLPTKQADLTQWCTNEWILRNETLSGLVTKGYLAVVRDTISGTSPYFDSITENTAGNVRIAQSMSVGDDLTVVDDATIGDDLTVGGDIIDDDGGIPTAPVKATTAAITLYVRTTGSDSNEGLTIATALLTIQAAIDKIPEFIRHAVVINIGAGTFTGFYLYGYHVIEPGQLTIKGTLGTPTISGKTGGTATGGTTRQLVDAAGGWTINALRGMLVLIGSEYRVVRNNTANTINFAGAYAATCSGKTYAIVEQKTIINARHPDVTAGNGIVVFRGFQSSGREEAYVQDIEVSGSISTEPGIWVMYGRNGPVVERVKVDGALYGWGGQEMANYVGKAIDSYFENCAAYGIIVFRCHEIRDIDRVYVYNSSYQGIYATTVSYANMGEIYIDDCTSHGLMFDTCAYGDVDRSGITGNGGYGVYVDENSSGNVTAFTLLSMTGTHDISNNTSGGIAAKNHSVIGLTDCDGTGNGGFGLTLEVGSYVTVTSATGITGVSGDATIDGGTALTWATDFATDGDIVVNPYNGCRIERKD